MLLKGSCHCGSVQFEVESPHPYPFNLCYCSICRKTAGAGGYAINISGRNETLKVKGKKYLRVYEAILREDGYESVSEGQRNFCSRCGSALWLWDPNWPELIHPHASAIDTPLPTPPERTHLMLGSKASWIEVKTDPQDQCYEGYPKESIAAWHQRLGLER